MPGFFVGLEAKNRISAPPREISGWLPSAIWSPGGINAQAGILSREKLQNLVRAKCAC
jgi:hypothetical protein